ncbi:MAG TPA: ATP-binding cassette domain-containing protein [Nannocystis exedens]|nr:ATP-binding cassette domain-containing protein [Nannocystis exedens]
MTPRPPASLEIAALSHRYRGASSYALDDVSFSVSPGERLGLLGPNGAGKSTLMRLFCGYLAVQARRGRPPGEARITVAGIDVARESLRARQQIGYLPEQVPLYHELRVREHLAFRARVKGVARRQREGEIMRVCELTGLASMLEIPVHQLSRGYRQRVGIADALLGGPPLLVLDEPTVGLDPNQVQDIRSVLRSLGGVQTLIFSSHILAEVAALCDRVVILARGKVVADEAVELATPAHEVLAEWEVGVAKVRELVAQVAGRWPPEAVRISATNEQGSTTTVKISCSGSEIADELRIALGRISARQQIPLVRLEIGRRSLEERFALATGAVEDRRHAR